MLECSTESLKRFMLSKEDVMFGDADEEDP
jgi:hypothetical protein